MKLVKLSLLAVLAAFSVPVTAQQAEAMHGYLRDAWGRPVEGAEIKALGSGARVLTDTAGFYSLPVTSKDRRVRIKVKYTKPTRVKIKGVDLSGDVNMDLSLYDAYGRGFFTEKDGEHTYVLGSIDVSWEDIFKMRYPNHTIYDPETGRVFFRGNQGWCDYYELDGAPVADLNAVMPPLIRSITIIKFGTSNKYGAAGQNGAVILESRVQRNTPVQMSTINYSRLRGEEGLKKAVEFQGEGITYRDGYVWIDGKRCELYIINDMEVKNIAALHPEYIDDMMIVRSGVEKTYGEKARNGVVLINASRKK